MKKRKHLYKEETRFDTYQTRQHFLDPTICMKCGALYKNEQWSWDDLPEEAYEALCPACQRIADNYPAGYIELRGNYFEQNEEEILNMIRHVALLEQFHHPLERIMNVDPVADYTLVTTTGKHLARCIGEALTNTYQGEIKYSYDADGFVRIWWLR